MKNSMSIPIVLFLLISLSAPVSASINAVRALDVERMTSPATLKAAQELMNATFTDAAAAGAPGFELQKLLLEKSGACISRIVEVQHTHALPTATALELLAHNRKLITTILEHNQGIVAALQEHNLDGMQNTEQFFKSAAWQQPQHLISLAGYWQSWNGYYRAVLMDSGASGRAELLEQARQGFSRAFIDFQEQAITTRSLFGRMLCFKESGRYDSAMQDAEALLAMTSPSDALYVRCRYEQLVIAYQRGACADVLKGVESFRNDIGPADIPAAISGGLKTLSVQCGIATIEEAEKKGASGPAPYRSVLQDLRTLAAHEPARAPILYRFVAERPDVFTAMPVSELGAVGNLALADHLFKKQQWQEALERYAQVLAADDAAVKSRKDEILFHLACCECKRERWEQASAYFSRLFNEHPSSKHLAQAACFYYAAAAQAYQSDKTSEHHQRYIAASKRYLEKCTDQQNACEARYQLGSHYLEQQRTQEALKEFERIKPGSPRYLEARFHIVRSRIDAFERQYAGIAARSSDGRSAYRQALQLSNEYAAAIERSKLPGREQLRAYVATLQARLLMHGPEPDYAKALKLLQNLPAASDRSTTLTASGLRIECFQHLGASDKARHEIDARINNPPLSSDVWAMLQETAARLYAASKELRQQQDRRASDFAETALHMYSALAREASRNSARAEFLEALSLRIAEIHRDENRLDAARALYEEQLARDASSADALYNLALIYEQQSDWAQAASCWRKLTRGLQAGTPRWFEARRQTVIALKQLGELKQACDYATMTLVLHPDIADPETAQTFMQLRKELCGSQAVQ